MPGGAVAVSAHDIARICGGRGVGVTDEVDVDMVTASMTSRRRRGCWILTAAFASGALPFGCTTPAPPSPRAPVSTAPPTSRSPAAPTAGVDEGAGAEAPVASMPVCPAPAAAEHRTLLALYRQVVGDWLGERREALERVARGPREDLRGEAALAQANDSALWLEIELGERLIDPVVARAAHPAVRQLLREVRAQPVGRHAGPLVAIGGMGGTLDLAGCEPTWGRSSPYCERARAAYWLLDFHAVRLLPNLTWKSYRPPDFEAEQTEAAGEPSAEVSAEPKRSSETPPCPPPRTLEVGFAFTRIFDHAIEAGLSRAAAERIAVDLFADLAARVEGDPVPEEADALRRAYVVEAHRVLTEAERARLTPQPADNLGAASAVPLDAVLSRLAWGDAQRAVDAPESSRLDTCPIDSYREFRYCAEPFVRLSDACPTAPLNRAKACLHDAYLAHVVASLRALVRRNAPEATLAPAFEELLRLAETNAGSRAKFVERVVEGYGRVRGVER